MLLPSQANILTEGCFYCTGRKPRGAYKLCNTGSTNADKRRVCSEGATPTRQPLLQTPKLARITPCQLSRESSANPRNLGASPLIPAPGATATVTPSSTDPVPQEESINLETNAGAGENLCRVSKLRVRFPPPHPYPPALPVLYLSPYIPRSCVLRGGTYSMKEPKSFLSSTESTPYCSSRCSGTKASSGRQAPIGRGWL